MRAESRKALLSEFIGQTVKVLESSCKAVHGLTGVVLDETQHTFWVQTENGRKRIPKKNTVFLFESGRLEGNDILVRPEDRLKKLKQ